MDQGLHFPFYTGQRDEPYPAGPHELQHERARRLTHPRYYVPDEGLRDAVGVALLLGQPLLLTGEPGTGKTQLAYSLAWELGFGRPLVFETKSSSKASDLFYTFDTLRRFHAAQTGAGSNDNLDYVTYNALGRAILLACPPERVRPFLPEGFVHDGPRRSVVLIDEIDKAPRDFPNDLLNELEEMFFRVPELGNVRIPPLDDAGQGDVGQWRPIVLITSNSEKHLPDAFLRRCVYYDIPFPDKERLRRIVQTRLGTGDGDDGAAPGVAPEAPGVEAAAPGTVADTPLLDSALDFFLTLRKPISRMRKKPATSELLEWLTALRRLGARPGEPIQHQDALVRRTMSLLTKAAEDQEQAAAIWNQWREAPAP